MYLYTAMLLCLASLGVFGDTPANCTYESIRGTWTFYVGEGGGDNTVNCTNFTPEDTYEVTLDFPDVAVDQFGTKGRWTLIYNQGFEVRIIGKRFFAFSKFEKNGKTVTSKCSETFPGWVHDDNGRNWACYLGKKGGKNQHVELEQKSQLSAKAIDQHALYKISEDYINKINTHQSSWRATFYQEYNKFNLLEITRRSGGRRSADAFPKTAQITQETQKVADHLPTSFDWRDRNGVNFVSPVRDQKACGSCYAFGSMALHESRLRIATNNTVQLVFSTQAIVSCSEYSQGCDGGFPYLIAGKYGQDFGLIEDSCFPYKAKDENCVYIECERYYTRDYYYIGGFYGACNEALMRIDLVKNGPLAVSFEVYSDFPHYKGGIYHHTGLEDRFNPWEITNHVVLIVGYGVDEDTNEKFWIVKNSWGLKWGESGYFRIRRGTDECSMESMAVGIFPVLYT